MKKCRICGKYLPESKFYKATANKDGLRCECKRCNYEYFKLHKAHEVHEKSQCYVQDDSEQTCGGYKIYILNYAKKGEFKYNIVSTEGSVYNYNDVNEFYEKMKEVLCQK